MNERTPRGSPRRRDGAGGGGRPPRDTSERSEAAPRRGPPRDGGERNDGPPRRGPPRRDGRDRDDRRGPPRDAPLAADAPPVLRSIQKVRTPHGTRVARRITCTSCGAQDTIDFAPKSPTEVLCRKCAFEQRGVVDPDDAAARSRRIRCQVCARFFEVAVDLKRLHESPKVCSDCRAGVETQQQDRSKQATRVSAKVVRARRRPAGDD